MKYVPTKYCLCTGIETPSRRNVCGEEDSLPTTRVSHLHEEWNRESKVDGALVGPRAFGPLAVGPRAGGPQRGSAQARPLGRRLALAAPVGQLRDPLQQLRVEELLQPLGIFVDLGIRLQTLTIKRSILCLNLPCANWLCVARKLSVYTVYYLSKSQSN